MWLNRRVARPVDHFYPESGQLDVVPERGGGVDVLSWSSSPVAYQRKTRTPSSACGGSGRASLVHSESGPAHGRKPTHPATRACPAAAESRYWGGTRVPPDGGITVLVLLVGGPLGRRELSTDPGGGPGLARCR